MYATTGVPRECAYHASIAVPSSGEVNAASTASHASMSARSPSTIAASFPAVRPRKSRRIGSTGSWPRARSSSAARRRYSSANGGPARYTRICLQYGAVSELPEFTALGHAGSEHYAGLETFPNPGVELVEMTSDELTAMCPVTGQPDMYVASIEYAPDELCLESKSLKLYLARFRNEGAFCEALAVQDPRRRRRGAPPRSGARDVTLEQKARGGITITAIA